ncbi:TIGR02594 family protein [Bradyrhizobium sp. WSM 1738]|uniref:TIGR02594 family protein n=1 Tax=Bradyrhizobium hereditatis TaxID=2821405 RepID=UPI001CE2C2BF|nr:TIGR02594 family protein [Bradyrhizobium hereditatis]MCA6115872.1 TIGR02594 family protein [Bradyrhizobium hereditatis]
MSQLFAFRRSLRFMALALCSASIFVFVSPASARPHHGAGRHARAYHAGHHAKHYAYRHHRHVRRTSRWEHGAAQMQAGGFAEFNPSYIQGGPQMAPAGFGSSNVTEARADRGSRRARARHAAHEKRWERAVARMNARGLADANASVTPAAAVTSNETVTPTGGAMATGYSSSNIVAEARKYLGGNPTGRGSLWCARFMNMVLQHSGYRGTGSDMASSFAKYGQRVSGPQVGAIAVMTRGRRGGHVGIITGIDAKGNPIMISGNSGNRVREMPVSRDRIYAYVMPTS